MAGSQGSNSSPSTIFSPMKPFRMFYGNAKQQSYKTEQQQICCSKQLSGDRTTPPSRAPTPGNPPPSDYVFKFSPGSDQRPHAMSGAAARTPWEDPNGYIYIYICIYIYIYMYIHMYIYLQPDKNLWMYPTSIGRWGFQDQGGCTPLPCLASRCISSIPNPRVQTPWNLSPACDSAGPRSVGVIDTSPTGLSQGSGNAQSKGHTHTKHTHTHATHRWSLNRTPT